MAESAESKVKKHWIVVWMVVVVSLIFAISMVTYTVNITEHALQLRFGKPVSDSSGAVRVSEPGLNWKLPWDTVWRADKRINSFEGKMGVVEEAFTADGRNIIVTAFVNWRISNDHAIRYLERVKDKEKAEEELTALLRSYKGGVLGKYNFSQLINIDPKKVDLGKVEADMLAHIQKDALELYGIDVTSVGIKHLGLPSSVTNKVFERMKAEREAISKRILAEGDAESVRLRAEADKQREQVLAEAEAKAKSIRAEGDAAAAEHYAVFQQSPELAAFLRKLDALKRTLSDEKTTLILDTNSAPYDLLRKDATNLHKNGKK